MNIFDAVDEFLLRRTQEVARAACRSFGITNLQISLGFMMFFAALNLRAFAGMITTHFPGEVSVVGLIAAVGSCWFILFVSKSVVANTNAVKPGTLNLNRTEMRGMRLSFLVIGSVLTLKTISECLALADHGYLYNLVRLLLSAGPHFLIFCAGMYFGSIEPEPPSESRPKKLIGAT